MKYRAILTTASLAVAALLLLPASVTATSQSIVISELQTAVADDPTQEFIELYNNSGADVDVTGWKVEYLSSGYDWATHPAATRQMATLAGAIRSHSHILLGHNVSGADVTLQDCAASTGCLASSGGYVRLMDGDDTVDVIAWGSAKPPVGSAAKAPDSGHSLNRKTTGAQATDTDDSSLDFEELSISTPTAGGLIEISDDVCPNLTGNQAEVPSGYVLSGGDCVIDADHTYRAIKLSEVLPDPSTVADDQGEYIELYNSHDTAVSLTGYRLESGADYQYDYTLDGEIAAHGYLTIYASVSHLVLSNSGSSVRLLSPRTDVADVLDETTYATIGPDQAWALIGTTWQLTDKPTPMAANELVTLSEDDQSGQAAEATPLPCPAGKYRNPATNRCRTIETAVASLTPCDEDEVRSAETNRCRRVVLSAAATPCREGYERNPDTNRCRKVVAAGGNDPKPCQAGYERNAETNRCRKIQTAVASSVQAAPEQAVPLGTWLLGGGALAALAGYGIYEWRSEIVTASRRLVARFRR